jgi:hypothetical protein
MELPVLDKNRSTHTFLSLNFYRGNVFTKIPGNTEIELKIDRPNKNGIACGKYRFPPSR